MNENVRDLNSTEFKELIASCKLPILIDFWATWCGPCRMQSPILHDLADELVGKIVVAKVNVDENEEIASIYGISSIPALMVFSKGEVVDKSIGLTSKAALSAMLIKHI